jgi:hypothetical protein
VPGIVGAVQLIPSNDLPTAFELLIPVDTIYAPFPPEVLDQYPNGNEDAVQLTPLSE